MIGYASQALSKSESHYPAHKLEFLALKQAVTKSFPEYLYGNTFNVYSDNNSLTYVLTMAKLDAIRHQWIAKLAKVNFTIHYSSGKSNVNADTLSRIPLDQNIDVDAVGPIFKAAIDVPEARMEVFTCHKRAISSLILEFPSTQMTTTEWVHAQKADPAINQVITWIKDGKHSTVKVSEEMSQEVKQYLRQKGQLCLKEGVLYWCRSQTQRDCIELQLVVPPDYRLEAMHGAHNDVGQLGLEQMLNILHNRFYWPSMDVDATHHVSTCEQCLSFKSKQDKAELYLLLATYPLELVHMDFLTTENPHTGADINILVLTDHFT